MIEKKIFFLAESVVVLLKGTFPLTVIWFPSTQNNRNSLFQCPKWQGKVFNQHYILKSAFNK